LKGHIPVLPSEVLSYLENRSPLVDCTTGGGGHLELLSSKLNANAEILAIDRDKDMLKATAESLDDDRIKYVHGKFSDIEKHIKKLKNPPQAIMADLGVSSFQLDENNRGFSLNRDGPLDMRMDRTQSFTAGKLLGMISEKELREALRVESDEKKATAIARGLKREVEAGRVNSTLKLANVIRDIAGRGGRIDPATRTFQTIRRLVNQEGRELEYLLNKAPDCLAPGGRLLVISFHSGEDRVVKNIFNEKVREGGFKLLTKKPLLPTDEECRLNPRSRSSRMRVLEKLV
jgi:16S rRNA (cytosine1402-N4)-methyltransferase